MYIIGTPTEEELQKISHSEFMNHYMNKSLYGINKKHTHESSSSHVYAVLSNGNTIQYTKF